ncbi:MAG: hypothetical protein L3J96_08035 [Thermoplasmata archaeon]|nr:hypothetical protein [Thermoplasmata archaeon]
MAGKRRKPPDLVPGFERVPGPLRHYRNIATGEELSRRQYQQRARGYFYEKVPKGRARDVSRGKWLGHWVKLARERFEEYRKMTKTSILRFWRKMGWTPPHHGKRKPSPAESAKELAFTDMIGYHRSAAAQLYPTLQSGAETLEGPSLPSDAPPAGRVPTSPLTTSSRGRSADRIPY